METEFYVDGSARGNPGPGGYGIVIVQDNKVVDKISHQESMTTNNRMELSAIIHVMVKYGKSPPPKVYSDSAYAINTLTSWMWTWEKNGWVTSKGTVPENLDLISIYRSHYDLGKRIELIKVKGHSNIEFNELADKLAKGEIK